MIKKTAIQCALVAALGGVAAAQEGPVPKGIPQLDHVFVIMMENHSYSQIIDNPNAPFINKYAKQANMATNYFAVAHPSLTNYLEVVGGSNFGILTDNYPDWHNKTCTPNLANGMVSTDNPASSIICPISGTGTDAAISALDFTNETQGPPGTINIDGTESVPSNSSTVGRTISDQLVAAGLSWKSYQQNLPAAGADMVNFSDGFFTDSTNFSTLLPVLTPPLGQGDVVALYAAKHNPFVYFRNVQEGHNPHNSLANSVDFDGARGLYADLASHDVPSYSFIVPNQCLDQHGRGNGGAFCNFDPNDNGTQEGLNPALILQGDLTVQKLVHAIHASPAWGSGKSAIVLLWDENDYSVSPNKNQVLVVVDTNYAPGGASSGHRYTHFSLLKSVEAAFRLPCLNHACDSSVDVMSDLFAAAHEHGGH